MQHTDTLALPLAPIEPDHSTCPAALPWLPWDTLAARVADGENIVGEVKAHITSAIRGRAVSLATMIALRAWRDDAVREAMRAINNKAQAIMLDREGYVR